MRSRSAPLVRAGIAGSLLCDASPALAWAQVAGEHPDAARIEAALRDAYEGLEPAQPSLFDQVLARIGEAIRWLLERLADAFTDSPFGVVMGWFLIFALIAVVALLVARIGKDLVPEAASPWQRDGATLVDWRRGADDALAAGNLDAAVHALYHVLVHTLAARGYVRDAPSLTAGECRDAVRASRPTLSDAVDPATGAFERVAYGRERASADDVDLLRTAERVVSTR